MGLLRITDVYLNSVVRDFGRNGFEACTGSMELRGEGQTGRRRRRGGKRSIDRSRSTDNVSMMGTACGGERGLWHLYSE